MSGTCRAGVLLPNLPEITLLWYLLSASALAWAQAEAAVDGLEAEGSVKNVLLSWAPQG